MSKILTLGGVLSIQIPLFANGRFLILGYHKNRAKVHCRNKERKMEHNAFFAKLCELEQDYETLQNCL